MTAVAVWDFTIWDKEFELREDNIIDYLIIFSKKYCFQHEDAGSGKHYQGRVSLKVKSRKIPPVEFGCHWTRTNGMCLGDDFYVCKDETRVEGPWRDDDIRIPRQILEIKELYDWQNSVIAISKIWDSRSVNVIVDRDGCKGKSILVGKMCCDLKMARSIPPISNYKEIMCMVMNMPESKCYLIDMPRALDKSKQEEFFAAIESIKDGHVWDNRYSYKEKWFDSPVV